MRDSIVFYRNWYEAIEKIASPEDRAKCYGALMRYGLDGEITNGDGLESIVLGMAQGQIDKNNERYENGKKGGSYGKLGGRPKKKPEPEGTEDKKPVGVEKITPKGLEKKPEAMRFRKPSVEEVALYCQERGNNIDAQAFIDHYESNGWKIGGKSGMKDWKAAVRTWERNEFSSGRKSNVKAFGRQDNNDFFQSIGVI